MAKKEPEFSETDQVSGTESFVSEQDVDVSLDALFSQLSKEINPRADDKTSFEKIQDSIKKIPTINSQLEQQLAAKSQSKDIIRINDPIAVALKQQQKIDKDADSGLAWFNMKKPEITPEISRDLLVIKHRSALDPKRHYKKEKWETPKFFHVGTIVEGNTEFYSGRMNRKARGKTLVEEILKDDDTAKYFRRKYHEIQQQKTSGGKKHLKKMMSTKRKYQ